MKRNLAILAAASLMVVGLARCGTPSGTSDVGNNGPPKDATVEKKDASATDLCGNGAIDGEEQCDGTNLDGKTCVTENFGGGDLACKSDCTFNFAACTAGVDCGNGTLDANEQCDGTNLDNKTCQTEGFDSGQLSCNANCSLNTSACVKAAQPDAGDVVKTDGGGTKENTNALCSDSLDNDDNGFMDCKDFGCCKNGVPAQGVTVCATGTCFGPGNEEYDAGPRPPRDAGGPTENTDDLCSDGQDNDGNNHKDCDDWSCCKDGVPANGVTVCATGTCFGPGKGASDAGTTGPKENTDTLCSDGQDNDNNNHKDCDDWSCCKDGVPANGVTVCATGTCFGPGKGASDAGTTTPKDAGGPTVPEDNDTTCNDGVDNDNDTYTDCNDHSCCKYGIPQNGVTVCTFGTCGGGLRDGGLGAYENTTASCGDGLDNDDDGYKDCNDNSCCASGVPYTGVSGCESGTCFGPGREIDTTANANGKCSDGIDNNSNKFTDCSDFDCCRPNKDGGLATIPTGLTVCDPVTCVGPGKAGKDAGTTP